MCLFAPAPYYKLNKGYKKALEKYPLSITYNDQTFLKSSLTGYYDIIRSILIIYIQCILALLTLLLTQ